MPSTNSALEIRKNSAGRTWDQSATDPTPKSIGRLLQQIVVGLCLVGFEKLFVNAVDQPVSSSNSAVSIESETGRSHGRVRTDAPIPDNFLVLRAATVAGKGTCVVIIVWSSA